MLNDLQYDSNNGTVLQKLFEFENLLSYTPEKINFEYAQNYNLSEFNQAITEDGNFKSFFEIMINCDLYASHIVRDSGSFSDERNPNDNLNKILDSGEILSGKNLELKHIRMLIMVLLILFIPALFFQRKHEIRI